MSISSYASHKIVITFLLASLLHIRIVIAIWFYAERRPEQLCGKPAIAVSIVDGLRLVQRPGVLLAVAVRLVDHLTVVNGTQEPVPVHILMEQDAGDHVHVRRHSLVRPSLAGIWLIIAILVDKSIVVKPKCRPRVVKIVQVSRHARWGVVVPYHFDVRHCRSTAYIVVAEQTVKHVQHGVLVSRVEVLVEDRIDRGSRQSDSIAH